MTKFSKVKNFLFLNNTWTFTLNSQEVNVSVTNNKSIEINGQENPSIYNNNMGRLEFVYNDKMFYICPGNALPFFGLNVQLYMDQINVINGRQYHVTPMYQYLILLLATYLFGIFCGFWTLIPLAVYSVCLYLYFRHRKYIIVQLPSQLREHQGESVINIPSDQSKESLLNYSSTNPIMTRVVVPIQEKFHEFRNNQTVVGAPNQTPSISNTQHEIKSQQVQQPVYTFVNPTPMQQQQQQQVHVQPLQPVQQNIYPQYQAIYAPQPYPQPNSQLYPSYLPPMPQQPQPTLTPKSLE